MGWRGWREKEKTDNEADLGIMGASPPLDVSQMRDGDGDHRDQPQVLEVWI